MSRRFAGACAALAALSAARAWATTYVPMPIEDLTRSSAAVVIGTVTHLAGAQSHEGGVVTLVTVVVDQVVRGELPATVITLKEAGGTVGHLREVMFGTPRFAVGEHVLLFLTTWRDGSLRTNHLALGKFHLEVDAAGVPQAAQQFERGTLVIVPPGVSWPAATVPLDELLDAVRHAPSPSTSRAATIPRAAPSEAGDRSLLGEVSEPVILNGPGRFFEPDEGGPVSFLIDQTGDATLGLAASRQAIDDAFAAWTNVATATISLQDGGLTGDLSTPCTGPHKILFNDPDGTIPQPENCHGTLAVGGFCGSSHELKVFNQTIFERAVRGKVTFANGWDGCAVWTPCNLAEIATHEVGHVIGLGHSSQRDPEPDALLSDATMYFRAHFDGRCADVRTYDIDGVSFIYPTAIPPTITTASPLPNGRAGVSYNQTLTATGGAGDFTWTMTIGGFSGLTLSPDGVISGVPAFGGTGSFRITATDQNNDSHTKVLDITVSGPTATPTKTPTATRTPTRTATFAPTASVTRTPTPSRTSTPTNTLTVTPTVPPTNTETPTQTSTPTGTETPTPTVNATPTDSATPSPVTPTPTMALSPTPSATVPAVCVGDCNNSGNVTVTDILTMVRIALDNADVKSCKAGDRNKDGLIMVDEIVAAVNSVLRGCEAS